VKRVICILILAISSLLICASPFVDIDAGLTGVNWSSTAWGDYDNDNDLDVIVSGYTGSVRTTKIYRNDSSGVFTDINVAMEQVNAGSLEWGDYDNDGYLDILLTGSNGTAWITRIYHNNGDGTFTDINAGITGAVFGGGTWGDYDNDGDLDIVITGDTGSGYVSEIFRNDGSGVFTDINAGLTPLIESSVSWGDFDNDGDLDILLTGYNGNFISKIYSNDSNGVFTDINAGLVGVTRSSAAWGDYDCDGDLDIVLTGYSGSSSISRIYRNDSGVFTEINCGIPGVNYGSIKWGDCDNDGDLDVLITGISGVSEITEIYRNDGSDIFSNFNAGITEAGNSSTSWGDYDNDNDLDIIITGYSGSEYFSKIYRNDCTTPNSLPKSPKNLSVIVSGNDAALSWDKASDEHTLQDGLSYNIYISSKSGEVDIKSPMSDLTTGYRKIAAFGNSSQNNFWTVKNLPTGDYYWSVQSIDNAFAGSEFATENSFNVIPDAPLALNATNISPNSFTANWQFCDDVTGYIVDVDDNIDFSSPIAGYDSLDVGNVNLLTVTGLISNSLYYYRVRSYNSFGTSLHSNAITVQTLNQFSDVNVGLPGVYESSVAWGDYDNDGDLDLIITGATGSIGISKVYRNDNGLFTDLNVELVGVYYSSADWGDYDNDGDLDILITGYLDNEEAVTRIYKNDSGLFTDIIAGLPNVGRSSVAWGDYDNDGDSDILITGSQWDGQWNLSRIYRNDSGIFTDINAVLEAVNNSSVAWGDYDNDGDLDILLTGMNDSYTAISKIYRNDSGSFTDISASLTGVYYSSADWGDYDNDGDLDILLTGNTGTADVSKIYRNDNGNFTDIIAGLTGVGFSSVCWGDYDTDGDLDILLTGYTGSVDISKIYKNDNGVFTDINAPFQQVHSSSVAWGDYDNDSDLDVLITGYAGSVGVSKLYRNNNSIPNTVPVPPQNLSSVVDQYKATLTWDETIDNETTQAGLTYNLYVRTESGTEYRKSPLSDLSDGYRKIVKAGNVFHRNSYEIKNLPGGRYYWSVQAIDNTYAGSPFSPEGTFLTIPDTPVAERATETTADSFIAHWRSTAFTDGYIIDVDDNSDFSSPLTGYNSLDVGNVVSYTIDNLTEAKIYYYRIRSYNSAGSSLSSLTVMVPMYFLEINVGLTAVGASSVGWGDYDNDGDLDILLTGNTGAANISTIYRNDGNNTFTDINTGLAGVCYGSVGWGDYDNDGDLDILLTGRDNSSGRVSKIYCNNGNNTFTDINAGLTGVDYSSAAWGDYDNDGDLDILLTGATGDWQAYNPISKIYRNNGNNTFTDINAGLSAVYVSSTAWGDFDNDGDLDILLSGYTSSSAISKVYRNNGNSTFTDINSGLTGVGGSSVAWGDYDNDGDLDILLTGIDTSYNPISKIYRNDNGVFTDINSGLTGVGGSSVAWGDYDNDGDLDILLSGQIYKNDSGSFTDINAGLTGVYWSSSAWGDYDNDRDLDILLTGKVYSNNIDVANTIPVSPQNLSCVNSGYDVILSWEKAADNETPQNGLSYNICIGAYSDSCNIKDPMSDISTGYRKIISIGNAGQEVSWYVNGIAGGQYYWRVQAVDHSYAGSEFSSEGMFYTLPLAPSANEASNIGFTGFLASWTSSAGATGYRIDVDDNSDFSSPLADYNNLDLGNVLSCTVSDLPEVNTYYYRVRAYNAVGISRYSLTVIVESPLFTVMNTTFADVLYSSSTWGDYDNDGDLDILLTGHTGSGRISRIYQNNNGSFSDINAALTGVYAGSVAWGDYDNDGDLDILLTGHTGSAYISRIYQNNNGTFTDINAGLPGVFDGSGCWGDYDNDGDLDILLTGYTGSAYYSKVYRNDGGSFTDISAPLMGVTSSSAAWGDYDNDDDLDLILNGYTGSVRTTKLYRNDGSGVFTDINAELEEVNGGSIAWGDYNDDGFIDILMTGSNGIVWISKIYRNNGNSTFTDINAGLPGLIGSSGGWGDYDNDGDLDIMLIGNPTEFGNSVANLYRNENGVFTYYNFRFNGACDGSVSWGDYDNDRDLDLLVTGSGTSIITRNNSIAQNTKPNPPVSISLSFNDSLNTTLFSWEKASDGETPQNGLSYNIDIFFREKTYLSSMSDITTGYRRTPENGNAGENLHYRMNKYLSLFPNEVSKELVAKVQAVDHCFIGSEFAVLDTTLVSEEIDVLSKEIMLPNDYLSWECLIPDSVLNYQLQLANDSSFTHPFTETIVSEIKNSSKNDKGLYYHVGLNELTNYDSLVNNEIYYWRIKPVYTNPERVTKFTGDNLSFHYNPLLLPPTNLTITVSGQFVTLDWSIVKISKSDVLYKIYSSNDPFTAFPANWTLENSTTNTYCILPSNTSKKFYCITVSNITELRRIEGIKNNTIK